jgi:hypothetical protein
MQRGLDGYEIAQLNVARLTAPLSSPQLQSFVDRLDEINELAEASPGFRWRLQGDGGDATDIRIGNDPLILVNMTVWATIDDLFMFTYRANHKSVFARRFEWFERWGGPSNVLWWLTAGTIPTVDDGLHRLDLLTEHGPHAEAFTFKQRFPAPTFV